MTKNLLSMIVLVFALVVSCGQESVTIAEVNGNEIKQKRFESFLKFKRIPTIDDQQKNRLLGDYLNREALTVAIDESKFMDENLLEAEINEFRKEMLISRYFEQYLRETVTDDSIKNYYDTHITDFEVKKAKVAHILLRTNPKMGEIERKAKLTTAGEAFSHVRSGDDFGEMALAYSEDKISAKKSGEIGWIKEGSVSPAFSKKVFSMKASEISEPLETNFGFHIIKLLEEPRVVRKSFDEVKGTIRYQLRNEVKKAETERLMAQVTIKRYDSKE